MSQVGLFGSWLDMLCSVEILFFFTCVRDEIWDVIMKWKEMFMRVELFLPPDALWCFVFSEVGKKRRDNPPFLTDIKASK